MRDEFAIDAMDRRIIFFNDVQDNAVIGSILVMMVALPVAGAHVDFDVAHPGVSVNLHLGIEEIRARIGVQQARVKDAHTAAVIGHDVLTEPQLVLPDVLQQSFHLFLVLSF